MSSSFRTITPAPPTSPKHKFAEARLKIEHEQNHDSEHKHVTTYPSRAFLMTNTSEARAHSTPHHIMSQRRRRRRRPQRTSTTRALLTVLASTIIIPTVIAQTATCIPLTGSATCPAFASSSISTDPFLIGLFPFLDGVTDVTSFDNNIRTYVSQGWVQAHYINLLGCAGIDLANTTAVYARYTTSFICNAIIQNSITTCGLSTADSQPLCADSCADFALSEQTIISTASICGSDPSSYALSQLRADFTNCALPANAITGNCIAGFRNEPTDCGFQDNIEGLCTYCSTSTVNSTDSCCLESNVGARCQGVKLPVFSSLQPLFTTTISGVPTTVTADPNPSSTGGVSAIPNTARARGLTGGQIAGIVVGAVLGALLLLGLLICLGLFIRRRKKEKNLRQELQYHRPRSLEPPMPPMTSAPARQYQMPRQTTSRLPGGGRVVGMTALERPIGDSPLTGSSPSTNNASSPESGLLITTPHSAGIAAIPTRRERSPQRYDGSSPTPIPGMAVTDNNNNNNSPDGSQDSDQIESFKDYYSGDVIFTGDLVSVLWAYQPRAEDEFELERGMMLRIVGIWDDGWATAVLVNSKAEDWEDDVGVARSSARDSVVGGISDGGEVRAFPLVCVCLPQHWRRTIDGDSSAEEPRTSEEGTQPGAQDDDDFYDIPRGQGAAYGGGGGGGGGGGHPTRRAELP